MNQTNEMQWLPAQLQQVVDEIASGNGTVATAESVLDLIEHAVRVERGSTLANRARWIDEVLENARWYNRNRGKYCA